MKTRTLFRAEARPMKHGQRFRLTRWAVAIAQSDGRNSAMLIPEGAIIKVVAGPFDGTPLMDVRYDGEVIMMFTNDMEDHTELIKKRNGVMARAIFTPAPAR